MDTDKRKDLGAFLIPFFVISIFFLDFFFPLPAAFWIFYFLPILVPLWLLEPDSRYLIRIASLCSFLAILAPAINTKKAEALILVLDRVFAVSFIWLLVFFMARFLKERRLARDTYLQKELFKALVESSPDTMFFQDLDMRYIYAGPKMRDFVAIDGENCAGKTNEECGIEQKLALLWKQTFRAAFRSRSPQSFEYPLTPGRRYARFTLIPHISVDGTVEAVIGYISDITELGQARENERMLESKCESLRSRAGNTGKTGNPTSRPLQEKSQ